MITVSRSNGDLSSRWDDNRIIGAMQIGQEDWIVITYSVSRQGFSTWRGTPGSWDHERFFSGNREGTTKARQRAYADFGSRVGINFEHLSMSDS